MRLLHERRVPPARLACAPIALAAALLFGCGGAPQTLSPAHPALSEQGRHLLAGAQDGVVVARATLADARRMREETERWAARVREGVRLPATGVDVQGPLERLVEARLAHARARVEAAEAEVRHFEARLARTTAEQIVAADLGTPDLPPLRAAEEAARSEATARRDALRRAREAVETVSGAFWVAYGRYAASGGDTRPLWAITS